MEIHTEADIDGAAAKALRESRDESQDVFWSRVGITQSGGWRYEQGTPIPKYVRILLFAIYVAGIDIDASTPEGADELKTLGALQHSNGAEQKAERLQEAARHLEAASNLLKDI
ncbi:MAG TPA: hypothetical protein VFW49_15000 [Fluviicoccus sp.]|nr:hypothetical protein [Fluviicoccus sp.]